MVRLLALVAGALVGTALVAGASSSPRPTPGTLLVQLRSSAASAEEDVLRRAGAELVVPALRTWRLESAEAATVVGQLERQGAVAHVQREHRYTGTLSTALVPDPLSGEEWWVAAVGAADLTPPGPGVPITIVDSGLDVTHPEFAGRPNTETLNPQEPQPLGGEHGTMVASVAAAPANGQGIVGLYPEAVLRSWDTALGDGTRLETVEIVNGILAAAQRGRGVINLSLGGTERDPLIEQAVAQATAKGALVVAASGNDGQLGSPLGYPAVLPHVVTVAATTRSGEVASFSSRSPYVDLAAPGVDITVATALGRGWQQSSGTSFASPIVAAAAAWVWTVRPDLDRGQLFEVLRRSARDIGPPGRDRQSGFGLLDVRAALAFPTPARDPLEPNDDIDLVDPQANDYVGLGALTTRTRPTTGVSASLDALEDPRDVYRVWVPRGRTLVVTATAAQGDVDLSLWRQGTLTTVTRVPGRDRLASAGTRGPTEALRYRNTSAGRTAYVAVTQRRGTLEASYRLTIAVR